ncbi:MAG: hypothetical protein HY769_00350 [Candidatus Stahlbacteria bacterium]|nr:hypothetical protein [Candidatus Stahlbacteria bacterium]
MWNKILGLDRRWIFLLTAVCIILPFILPMGLPMQVSPPVQNLYDKIDAIPPNGPALVLDFNCDASTLPELGPMAIAILQQCFKKNIKVILMGLSMPGVGIAQAMLEEVKVKFPDKQNGIDYVLMPYVVGFGIVVLRMGEDIHKTFETDYYGTPLDSLPMMQGIHNYDQIALVVCLTGSVTPWIAFANTRYGQEIGLGVTAVMAPEAYPYLQTNQVVGMIGGLKGAAEYETLLNKNLGFEGRKTACIGMDSQSIVHIVMILFIILGNIAYFATKKRVSNT